MIAMSLIVDRTRKVRTARDHAQSLTHRDEWKQREMGREPEGSAMKIRRTECQRKSNRENKSALQENLIRSTTTVTTVSFEGRAQSLPDYFMGHICFMDVFHFVQIIGPTLSISRSCSKSSVSVRTVGLVRSVHAVSTRIADTTPGILRE